MRLGRRIGVLSAVLGSLLLAVGGATAGTANARGHSSSPHVVLLSIDGLHQSDLTWWVRHHPHGALARLSRSGAEYANARTPVPSDSFPGLVGLLTGGDPRTTGIYYDDSYNRRLLPPGSSCTPGQTGGLGTEVNFSEAIARDPNSIDSGFGIPNLYPGLPSSVLRLPGGLRAIERGMIDTGALPISPRTCRPVYPHQYLKVNTVFGVLDRAGLRSAWSDKHAAYELVNGPGGRHVTDLFTPEINSSVTDPSLPAGPGPDWTENNRDTQFYDAIKVQAVVNEIRGFDHSGRRHVGTPSLLGMNFQSVSTAEKLPLSPLHGTDARGGYLLRHGRWVPGPVLRDALGFVDREVGRMVSALRDRGILGRTTFIVSSKHGQSPIQTSALKRIDDGNVIDALNAAWTAHGGSGTLVAFAIDDDAMYVWLNHRSASAVQFARRFLLHYSQPASAHAATDYQGSSIGFHASGLRKVAWGPSYFGVSRHDARVPDLVGIVQHGVVYTGKTSKIAEHGGQDAQDRHVPILIMGPGFGNGVVRRHVETTEIAPTILRALHISPDRLAAVRKQHTPALPRP
jgi:predicted AlkP superfamily pyrophosphatase or phosphodiesterase